jgi:predicted transcriptional regulator
MSLLLSRKEKEKLVIKLVKEGKTSKEIAKVVHISPTEIKKIIDKATGDAYSKPEVSEKEKQLKKIITISSCHSNVQRKIQT